MANQVNRREDGPPTQGRARECARRLRQLAKKQEKEALKQLVDVLCALTPEELARLEQLDEAQVAYLEEQVDIARAAVETAPAGTDPTDYAKAVLKALEKP